MAYFSKKIAEYIDYDENKAETAGLLHDIAREYSHEELLDIAKKYNVKLEETDTKFLPYLHGRVGAIIVENELDIHDKDILLAIKNHVTGRPSMCTLEKIVFLADHLDRLSKVYPDMISSFKDLTLDEAIIKLLAISLQHQLDRGRDIDERTLQTYDWLIQQAVLPKASKESIVSVVKEFDKIFDSVLDLSLKQQIKIDNVVNARDLGGYETTDGHKIKKNCLIRSACLQKLTDSGKETLKETNVNYIIDLRTEKECREQPNVKVEGIKYVNIPLVDNILSEEQESLINWYVNAKEDDEKAWLASEFVNCFDHKKVYRDVVENEKCHKAIRKIFDILLSDDCTGALIHCVSGKDRTGIIIGILLQLLDVNPETIQNDYYCSIVPYYLIITKKIYSLVTNENANADIRVALGYLGLEKSVPEFYFNLIHEKYKTGENFLKEAIKLTDEEIEKLKNKWVE